jgi:hypothetical protein
MGCLVNAIGQTAAENRKWDFDVAGKRSKEGKKMISYD